MSRLLPAACIRKGDRVRLTDEGGEAYEVEVQSVAFATPEAGRITWQTDRGPEVVGGARRVEVALLGS
jgi:hypothetical protein